MKYRAEIDGLRALAVLPVILFHAGFELFGGGFVGVDVFFVISGYLITSIIISEMGRDNFSLINFYERRARRILPALFFVMLVSIPFAWFWLTPGDLKDFGQSLIAVATFSSNILFWIESGYFATASELKPLLHTWSLAVEEQYYILFPLFLMIFWNLPKKYLLLLLALIFLLSLGFSEWASKNISSANFYLLPTRGWELLIGVFLAFYLQKNQYIKSPLINQTLSLLGFAMIVYSIAIYDKNTPFPSLYALVPTIGTALLILTAVPQTLIHKILSARIIVGIGLISYSAYLWHQPILAFARHRLLGEISEIVLLLLCLSSLIMAYISWRWVEKPFRDKQTISRKTVFSFSLAGILFFCTFGASLHINKGFPDRIGFTKKLINSFEMPKDENCFQVPYNHINEEWGCYLGVSKNELDYIVFGDSHASSLRYVIDSVAKSQNISVFFTGTSACPPFLGIYPSSKKELQEKNNCYELNKRVADFAVRESVKGIILSARWSFYTEYEYKRSHMKFISSSKYGPFNKKNSISAFEEGFNKTLNFYINNNIPVHLFSQPPHQIYPPRSSYLKILQDNELLNLLSVPRKKFHDMEKNYESVFKERLSDFNYYDLKDKFCNKEVCSMGNLHESYYFDDDHLSIIGANKLYETIDQIFNY